MKLAVIGGGGVRSLFLAKSIAQRAAVLGIRELVLMDSDADKLRIYGGLAVAAARRIQPDLLCRATEDAADAVLDADYVITTVRVGGDGMRVRDERIALSHGVLGQETTGAAGLSFAMRSVPVLARYCDLIRRLAKPAVRVFNFTNPAGVVSQALLDLGYDFTYGICDAPTGLLSQIAGLYGVPADCLDSICYGLNHLSFFPSIRLAGRELVTELIERPETYTQTDMRFFEPELARHMGMILNEYLYYYFYREQAVEHILKAPQTRGEIIEKINRQMTAELSGMRAEADFDACLACFEKWYGRREDAYMASETGVRRDRPWRFDLFAPDAGGYAGVALRFMDLVASGRSGSMILCVPNRGALPGLADDDIVEITCDITPGGCVPRSVPDPDPRAMALIRQVKLYERLASEAIRTRSIRAAIDCLMLHPLVNSYALARRLTAAYMDLNRDYLDGWA